MVNEELIRRIVENVIAQMDKQKDCSISPKEEEDFLVDNITDEKYLLDVLVTNPVDRDAIAFYKETTPARIGVGRSGDRPLTQTLLRFHADHAMAVDSVFSDVNDELINELDLIKLQTRITNKDEHLTRPDLGRELNQESAALLKNKCTDNPQVQIIVSDGLSSKAIEANIKDTIYSLKQGLELYNIKFGKPVFVKYGRVGVMDFIGDLIKPECSVILIGERPGMVTAESMSAYVTYRPHIGIKEADRSVISNIHKNGTPPVEAGAELADLMKSIIENGASGINLKNR